MKTRQSLRNVPSGAKKKLGVADAKIKKPAITKPRKPVEEPIDTSKDKKENPESSKVKADAKIRKEIETIATSVTTRIRKQVMKSLGPDSTSEENEKSLESKSVADLKSKKQTAAKKAEKELNDSIGDSTEEPETSTKAIEIKNQTQTGIKTRKQGIKPTLSNEGEGQSKTPLEVKGKKPDEEVLKMSTRKQLAQTATSSIEKEKEEERKEVMDLKTKKQTAAVKVEQELPEFLNLIVPKEKLEKVQELRKTVTDPNLKKSGEAAKIKASKTAVGLIDSGEEKENTSLDNFFQIIKTQCVLSERWVLNEPKLDISLQQNAILFVEINITIDGDLRVKRCVKILEDRSFKVLLDSVDMTHLFDVNKKISTTNDVVHLLYSVQMKKICQGLRNFVPENTLSSRDHYSVRLRGTLWYAKECTIVVQKVFMGNSCSVCSKIRNQIKRKAQNDARRRMQIKPTVKHVKRTFGKAVYSTLHEFIGKGVIPSSQCPREDMVYDEKLEIYINKELQTRIEAAASMPPPPPPPPKVSNRPSSKKRPKSTSSRGNRYSQPSSTMTSVVGGQEIQGLQEFITEDGQICYVTSVHPDSVQGMAGLSEQFQWGQMVVEKFEPPEMEEVMTLNDHENIIIQNIKGETFTLAEGQEYELIGEAQPTRDPIELISADNQQIQIIEVDDETLAQIQVHDGMDNMQVAHVDPNDPNFRQILQAFQAQGMTL